MNSRGRIFGQNLSYYMDKLDISVEEMSKKLGYTENEMYRIIDARQLVDLEDKKAISKILNISLEELETENNSIEYPCIECRGEFTTKENKDFILDLFDAYCDIQELLSFYRKECEL